MNEVSQLQQRRAMNIIWNAARSYAFQPDFKAYDADGQAELYWNIIIGAVRRHYDWPRLEKVFASFQQEEDRDEYEGLLWLGLENCVFLREEKDRPVLAWLRESYARRWLAQFGGQPDDYRLLDCMSCAHWRRVLGQPVHISRYDEKLLDELEFPPELDTDQIVARAEELLQRWFQIRLAERRQERHFTLPGFGKRDGRKGARRYRRFGLGFADHPKNLYGGASTEGGEQADLRTSLTPEELRAFMSAKFGRSLYPLPETRELERRLCTGSHQNCHLLITGGERGEAKIQNGFEALHREKEAAQIEKNRRAYQAELARNRAAERRLSEAIQNSVLLYLRPAAIRTDSGSLDGGRVWRGLYLDDDRIFTRQERGNMGEVSVDILLDASTSQKDRQETVSNQGYMIASALTQSGIPCRVMGFCSMTGYTILRIFRDYDRPRDNERIFEYVSNGCNRDGLAIRAARHLMEKSPWEHKLLIVLSDVKPNDIVRMPGAGEEEWIPYEKDAGIRDTALEVRRARAEGIAVICVFTGSDEDLPAAKLVYGRDFARIQSLDRLADTVGMLIRNQLRNL